MYWLSWCLLSMLSVTIRAFDCPKISGCSSCTIDPNGYYDIDCPTIFEPVFGLRIYPNELLKIRCSHGSPTNWTNFKLTLQSPMENIKVLSFEYCDLPDAKILGEIPRQLLRENVQGLVFKSYKNIGSSLTRDHLRSFSHVESLKLTNNRLSEVPHDLLHDLVNLTTLNLLENKLSKLPENFLAIPSLRVLELGLNQLESLAPNTFDKLERVHFLNVWANKIAEIHPHTFDKLVSLQSLDLSRNLLETLPSGIFSHLGNMTSINLSLNNFTENSLPGDLFRNNSLLETFRLFSNKRNMTTLPGGFFANMTQLRTVKLMRSGFTSLPDDLFWGATNLEDVSLDRNYLTTLSSNFFRDSSNMLSLGLSFNDLHWLPDDIFASLSKLKKLDLSRNRLTTINEKLFSGLLSLRELNMERNDLKDIHFPAFNFLHELRIARFSYNELTLRPKIKGFELASPFQACTNLEELYLAHNKIRNIFGDWQYTLLKLQKLDLSHNQIPFLQGTDVQFLSGKQGQPLTVDFRSNNISHVDLRLVQHWAMNMANPENLIILIGSNPIVCDCALHDLLRHIEGRMSPKIQSAFRLKVDDDLRCVEPDVHRGVLVSDLSSKTFTCDVNSLGVETSCPDKCNCYLRPNDRAFVVNCAYKGLKEAPKEVASPSFADHVVLNLTGNFLTSVPSFEQLGYDQITVLTLDHNNISSISLSTIPDKLQVLKLNGNNLTKLEQGVSDVIMNSTSLTDLTLRENPWACDCEARNLLKFMKFKAITTQSSNSLENV